MIGQQVLNYRVIAHLGEGGMGTVYRASDTVLQREVALKMLHATLIQQSQFLERFKKEARVLAQLLHPNIAVIYNFIEQDHHYYMVMEYVEGKNLEALLRQFRRMDHKQVVPIFIQALEGLQHAHKKGIYHRDIKPSNINLTPDGTVKLMDFGIAMMAGEQRLTQVNRVVGTVEYMAPELIQGKEPSCASDIYAMGITMYELLTGKLPFENPTDFNLMQDILKKKPVPVIQLNSAVPAAISRIIMKALEKKPEHRFADARTFQQALLQACPGMQHTDLSALYRQPPAPLTAVQPLQTVQETAMTMATRLSHGRHSLSRWMQYIQQVRWPHINLPREQRRVLIIMVAVILLTITGLFLFSPGDPEQVSQIRQNQDQPALNDSAATVKKATPQLSETNENAGPSPPAYIIPEPSRGEATEKEKKQKTPEKQTPERKEPVKKSRESVAGKKKGEEEKPEKETAQEASPVKEEQPVKKTEPEKPRHVPKHVELPARIEVTLYLQEAIQRDAAHDGQSLSFTVATPVRYDGAIIIDRGARAYGKIKKIGSRKLSIVFTQVIAANGQSIPFQEVELSGRIDDMLNSRTYTATLKKGIVLNL